MARVVGAALRRQRLRKVRRLQNLASRQGWTTKSVSRALGVSEDTVRRYFAYKTTPLGKRWDAVSELTDKLSQQVRDRKNPPSKGGRGDIDLERDVLPVVSVLAPLGLEKAKRVTDAALVIVKAACGN